MLLYQSEKQYENIKHNTENKDQNEQQFHRQYCLPIKYSRFVKTELQIIQLKCDCILDFLKNIRAKQK